MGLFVDKNGHYTGWLASFLCCFAALTEDEYPAERNKQDAKPTATDTPYQQTHALTTLPALPDPTGVSSRSRIDLDTDSLHDSQHSHSDPFPKSLDFDPESLLPSPVADSTRAEHDNFPLSRTPTNDTIRTIRHIRPSPGGSIRKQALVPIQLGPVVLRDAPGATQDDNLPSTSLRHANSRRQHQRSESTQDLLGDSQHQSYFAHRETPYQRCGRQSAEALVSRTTHRENIRQSQNEPGSAGPKATASMHSLSTSFRQHARDASSSSSILTLNERPRTGNRLQRKRSNQSKSSFGNSGDSDVEKEVLELNTIVEERRAEEEKRRSRNSRHVPAVAPSMQVGARSETLTDIGSAFSRPLTAHHVASDSAVHELDSKQIQGEDSRVPRWLSSVTASTQISTSTTASNNETFYKCDDTDTPHHNHSTLSANSSTTALGSVLYTLESSPTTSKRYSRSLMITPLTPVDDDIVAGNDDERRVGIAL